jgi:hypothetical protein
VLALRLYTKTYPFFDPFFKVDDFHESLIDPKSLLPLRYMHNLREGRYRCHEATTFDFEALEAHYLHIVNDKKKSYAIKSGMRDILSFMYFMRSVQIGESATHTYFVMSDEKIYDLVLTTFEVKPIDLPRYERNIPSLRAKPEAMFDGLFVRKGKATVWISRDSRRLLTFAKLKVPFGRVRVTLQEVNGPGEDFWITEKQDGDDEENR